MDLAKLLQDLAGFLTSDPQKTVIVFVLGGGFNALVGEWRSRTEAQRVEARIMAAEARVEALARQARVRDYNIGLINSARDYLLEFFDWSIQTLDDKNAESGNPMVFGPVRFLDEAAMDALAQAVAVVSSHVLQRSAGSAVPVGAAERATVGEARNAVLAAMEVQTRRALSDEPIVELSSDKRERAHLAALSAQLNQAYDRFNSMKRAHHEPPSEAT